MRPILTCCLLLLLVGCFKRRTPEGYFNTVWGSKPIYESDSILKKVIYSNTSQPVINAGNIYVKDNFLYQVEVGKGIHIINNTIPADAARTGFISINGCSQLSIKGDILYTNNYDDLVMVSIANPAQIKEVARTKGAFPTGKTYYPMSEPQESGPYYCPAADSLVIRWEKDSIPNSCFKN